MRVPNSRLRPVLVSLSVLVGVLAAAGGLLVTREPADEHLHVALTDSTSHPVSTMHQPSPVAPAPSSPAAPPSTTASPAPSTTASPPAPPPSTKSTPKPPPSTSTKAAPPRNNSVAAQVLALVNQERSKAGCGALSDDGRLDTAAQKFSEDMSARDYFSHVTPEGVTFDQRIKAAGYAKPAAENIAMGSTTAAQTMQMWMNSDGHRRNILNCSYHTLGVGLDTDGWYWVQDFGF
ncbi:uncharacterized protein YkwD [Amycolatopsis bartoniae]|uniref:SCP domain-containing protein n=2 Tax=Amycolatopsis bartoniae TaxID=941986 RepID=A0A8H9IY42_9PSEU|nr:CAP domain-containing protein [Amycolatopsis bartoniae]MBB2935334.1 uncharacterized protein YkwD [Amycolatopsis bartoniae]GHF56070.1 hypothetical protein GCM10017566_31500 [Amycolatopsis bartoniae]